MEIKYIEREFLKPDPKQPRESFENLNKLAETFKTKGIIQPLIVRRAQKFYYIIDGERRWKASKIANLKQLPCLIRPDPFTDEDILELQIISGLHAEKVKPEELAPKAIRLMEKKRWSWHSAAEHFGVAEGTIGDWREMTNMDKEEKQVVQLYRDTDGEKGISPSNIVELKRKVKDGRRKKRILNDSKIESIRRKDIRNFDEFGEIKKPEVDLDNFYPRPFNFRKEHIDMILEGKKIQTSRFWHFANEGDIVSIHLHEPDIAKVKIISKEDKKLKDLTEEDAKREGGYNLKQFKEVWKKIHGQWNPEASIKVFKFKLIK